MTEPTPTSTSDSTPPPVVCTLTTKALAEQSLEWSDVVPLALSAAALPHGARITFDLRDADTVEDLAGREMACCGSWLDIKSNRTDVVTLELTTTNPEGVDLIRSVAGINQP